MEGHLWLASTCPITCAPLIQVELSQVISSTSMQLDSPSSSLTHRRSLQISWIDVQVSIPTALGTSSHPTFSPVASLSSSCAMATRQLHLPSILPYESNNPSHSWRRLRKAAHEGLNKTVVKGYHHTQLKEAVFLASSMLREPNNWDKHFRRTAASSVMSVVYDTPIVESEQDPAVKSINNFMARLTRALLPGSHFVEFFPWMVHIPNRFAKWKREAEEWYASDSIMFEGLFDGVRADLVSHYLNSVTFTLDTDPRACSTRASIAPALQTPSSRNKTVTISLIVRMPGSPLPCSTSRPRTSVLLYSV